jgi:putative heme-binding domain-containing protein
VFTDFAKMDSPRGVAWDASTRTLYVMHPPNLTAYHDDTGDGITDREEDLIQGLGPDLNFRGADHTINGIRLGIDGWIYVACGDYGAVKATGKDGRTLSMLGGGIVRVRPDGSGLEQVSSGQRNILAVAISPMLDFFTRDNTNDGDDWNNRLSHVPFGAQMGYPSLFRNFSDEIIPAMIDFGGGSPVGAIFIDEPSLPGSWDHGFYSVEWGRSEIVLHPLTPNGATWKAGTNQFMKLPRATDLEVDGAGRLYAASWEGASYTYAGPNVGYLIRLTPKGKPPLTVPDLKKLSETQLVEQIGSASGVWRLAAQRELLLRGTKPGLPESLQRIVTANGPIGPRVAAMFTLKLLLGAGSHRFLFSQLPNAELREFALRALADDLRIAADVDSKPFVDALNDPNPRVRLQAVTALGRLGKTEVAAALLPRTADSDYTVAHVAVQSLRWLKASEACLRSLDAGDAKVQAGAMRVLQALHEPAVVEGLLQRLGQAEGELRRGIYRTLCRLNFQEAPFTNPRSWWGTRPDTSGPIFKPERWAMSDRIEAALKQQLEVADGEDAKSFVLSLLRMKVSFAGLSELMLVKVGHDTAALLDVLTAMITPRTPPREDVLKALASVATSETEKPELRVRALRLLNASVDRNFAAVRDAFLPLAGAEPIGVLATVWEEFTRDPRLARYVNEFATLAQDADPARRNLGATVLVNLATSTLSSEGRRGGRGGRGVDSRAAAQSAISRLWENPQQTATLLSAIGRTRAAQFESQVRERVNASEPPVAQAAQIAFNQLGLAQSTPSAARMIEGMDYDEVVKIAVATKGDAKLGEQLFLKQGCTACHTVSANDPPKGPMLGGITARYSRAELIESIIKPSAKLAQGFESQHFVLKNEDELDGFVVKEGGDSVEVRNVQGMTTVLEKADIVQRQRLERSIMPEKLVANITPEELASMLAFLEATAK